MSLPPPLPHPRAHTLAVVGYYLAFGGISFVEMAYVPRYLVALGLPVAWVGVALTLQTVAQCGASVVWASVVEQGRAHRWALLWQAGLSLLLLLGLPWVTQPLAAAAVVVALGVAHRSSMAIADALTIQVRGLERFGVIRAAASVGYGAMALGAAGLGLRLGHEEIARLAPWVVVVIAAGLTLSAWGLPAAPGRGGEGPAPSWGERLRALSQPSVWVLLTLAMLHWVTVVPYNSFLVFLCEERGLPGSVPGLAVGWAITCEVVLFIAAAWVLRRIPPRVAIPLSVGVTALRWWLGVVLPGAAPLVLVQGLHGLSVSIFQIAALSVVLGAMPASMRTTTQAAFHLLVFSVGNGLGALVCGGIIDRWGVEALFEAAAWLEGGVFALTLVWAWRVAGGQAGSQGRRHV